MDKPKSIEMPALSVSELSQKLKRTLEQQFDYVRVRGELSKVARPGSGHIYTDLKDENAVLKAVCWKNVVPSLAIQPVEGLEVICTGQITTYPMSSSYQLKIMQMELAGQGALLKMLEERKQRLLAEGLFAPERKKKLPFLPKTIGVITSPTGAVIRDILHRIADRFPTHVLVWPVLVQGETAAQSVIKAIEGFNAATAHRPDLLIVARGGGSVEDLMPFNDEALVRAVAASDIPVISAVGHETDTTLIDYAADVRAPTPTAAAEIAVPVRNDLYYTVQTHQQRIAQHIFALLRHRQSELKMLAARLGDPQRALESIQQRVDLAGSYLRQNMMRLLHVHQQRLQKINLQAHSPKNMLAQQSQNLAHQAQRLNRVIALTVQQQQQVLKHHTSLLESYSFRKTLERGFALVRNGDEQPVTRAEEAKKQAALHIQFADGVVKTVPQT
ncbi:MAG TPA: exodeoxyribonuclease VII large subunit [Alphaproteobacteria bacterium]